MLFKDKQAAFDFIIGCVVEQNEPCMSDDDTRMYRGNVGGKKTACASGHGISDEEYESYFITTSMGRRNRLEEQTVGSVLQTMGERAPEAWRQFPELFSQLQSAHDGPFRGSAWMREFLCRAEKVAKRLNLSFEKWTKLVG